MLRNFALLLWLFTYFPTSTLALEKIELEFKAFRLYQYEHRERIFGSKSWKILHEAVSIDDSTPRKCIIVYWRDLIGKDLNAELSHPIGSMLVIIPEKLEALSPNERQNFLALEQRFYGLKTELAVFFVPISPKVKALLKSVSGTNSTKATSAFNAMVNSLTADSYQISTSNSVTSNLVPVKAYNIIGQLNSRKERMPTIVVAAHYDSYAIAPSLAIGADSNGSGVAILVEVLNILSQFFQLPQSEPTYNVVFALTAAGKFGFQGSRSFIEDFNEKHPEDSIELAVCLDGLGRGNILYSHISKIPSPGTPSFRFYQHLKNFAGEEKNTVDQITKKISLSNLNWEHEVYNMKRIHAMTLSHFPTHTDPLRSSLLDVKSSLNNESIKRNTELLSNALIAYVFGLNSSLCTHAKIDAPCSLLPEHSGVNGERLRFYVDTFASRPRTIVQSAPKLIANLLEVVRHSAHHASLSEVSVTDYVFYGALSDKISANVVKPTIFDLFLASLIGAYLFGFYAITANAQKILSVKIF